MEYEATVTQDGGETNEALLSVDDLVAKIGELTVEIMHTKRLLDKTKREAAEKVAAAAAVESKAQSVASLAQTQLDQAKKYKESHDALSTKYNDLSMTHGLVRAELSDTKKRVSELTAEVDSLKAEVAKLTAERDALKAQVEQAGKPERRKR